MRWSVCNLSSHSCFRFNLISEFTRLVIKWKGLPMQCCFEVKKKENNYCITSQLNKITSPQKLPQYCSATHYASIVERVLPIAPLMRITFCDWLLLKLLLTFSPTLQHGCMVLMPLLWTWICSTPTHPPHPICAGSLHHTTNLPIPYINNS